MHTTQTHHHRIFFANVSNPDYLEGLCKDLGLTKVSDTIYDLALEEGTQLTVEEAVRVAIPVANLGGVDDRDSADLLSMLGCLSRLLQERGHLPHSSTFEADVDLQTLEGQDISCLELYDLLSAVAYGYEVKGIYTQWAMSSNKAEFGANAGGTRITMRSFSVPCQAYPDRAESVIDLLAKHKDTEIGDVFAMEFVLPLIDNPAILTKEMVLAVQASLHRFFGGSLPAINPWFVGRDQVATSPRAEDPLAGEYTPPITPGHINQALGQMRRQGMNPIDIEIKGVQMKGSTRKPPTLSDFRNFKGNMFTGWTDSQLFFLLWMGHSPHTDKLQQEGFCFPKDYEQTVTEIRDRLASGEDLVCPAIEKYNERAARFDQHAFRGGDILDRGRSVVEPQTHKPSEELTPIPQNHTSHQVDHTFGGVPMEQTGRDWSQESSSNRHFGGHDTPAQSQSDNNSSSSYDSPSSTPSE